VTAPARAVLLACAALCVTRGALAAPGASSFEALAREAAPVTDLGMLLAPFAGDCRRVGGELEIARCESVRSALRASLPARTFLYVRGTDAVLASPYDPRTRAVKLTVVGCLSCKQLVEAAPGERRYLTLRVPARGPSGGPVAAEVARAAVSFGSPAEAARWMKAVLPLLRVELLFRPADQPWTVGVSKGYAFTPLGVRISHRCTGEVLFSEPASQGAAPRDSQCEAPALAEADPPQEAPETLSPAAINEGMNQVRGDLDACAAEHRLGGATRLVFQVAGSGLPGSVTVEGSAAGTALGACLAAAGMKARFKPFRGPGQAFKYPVILRR
jgi:hypothetical protein